MRNLKYLLLVCQVVVSIQKTTRMRLASEVVLNIIVATSIIMLLNDTRMSFAGML